MKTLELRTFLVLFLLSLLLLFFDSRGFLNPVKSVASIVVMPVQYGFYSAKLGLQDTFSFLTFWKSGEARIKNLELRNLALISHEQEVKDLHKENDVLRKQMGESALIPKQMYPATVLFSGDYLEIAGGLVDGIREGQPVVIFDNYIGKISKVNPRTSIVQLPSDPDAKTPVKSGQARGLLVGQFNSSMSLEKVAQNEQISVDDLVLTSGEGDLVPNLIVGRIKEIKKSESDLFQTATVVPIVDFTGLTTVFVITN